MEQKRTFMKPIAVGLTVLVLAAAQLQAGLPQPMFIYYGQAKDGYGIPYQQDAEVVLLKDGKEIARSPINGSRVPGVNFALYAHLDDGRGDTPYTAKAVHSGEFVSIVVRDAYGQKTIMEQTVVPPVGPPGGQVAINVTAATDADGDLLPDQWETELISWSNGQLSGLHEVNAQDDFDGDGQSNGDEYRAGTFAFLDYDYFFAEAMAVTPNGRLAITFWGVPGKLYSAEHRPSMEPDAEWSMAPVAVTDTGEFQLITLEGRSDWLTLYLPKDMDNKFFRLQVR